MTEPTNRTCSTCANCHVDTGTQKKSSADLTPAGHARQFLNSAHASEIEGAPTRQEHYTSSKQSMKHAESFLDALHQSKHSSDMYDLSFLGSDLLSNDSSLDECLRNLCYGLIPLG